MKKKIILFAAVIFLILIFSAVFIYSLKQKKVILDQSSKEKYPELMIDKNNTINNPTEDDIKSLINDIKKQNKSFGDLEN